MTYYWFNSQEISQKAKKNILKKKLSQQEKDKIKECQRKRYQQLI